MLKLYTVALLFVLLLIVTSSFACVFVIVIAGVLFAIFNDFNGNISVLDHFLQKSRGFLWKLLHKSVPPNSKYCVTYKDLFWDMDKFNKSPSGSFYNWSEKSECFSPIYTSRLLPKYRTFAKATSTPLNSLRATPPPPEQQRYSYAKNHQAKSYGDNCYEGSSKSASRSWSNLNLSTYTDSRSYGLASRIVDYNAKAEERDNRPTNRAQRPFPIVRLFKKELPVISAKPSAVTVHIAHPDSANYEAEQRKLILQSIMQEKQPQPAENKETRSVLDALKEISRKRIHPDDELNIMQNGTSLSKNSNDTFSFSANSKRTKEDSSVLEKNDTAKSSSEKKKTDTNIPFVDPITASLTSSDKAFERQLLGKKRKAENGDSYETQKSVKVLKLHSVETQTTNDLLPEQPKDLQPAKDVDMENSKGESTEVTTKKQNPPLKVFDDKPLEINRKKKLALILGVLSGHEPDFGNLEKPMETHSILSPANKSKQEKHVTFNETVEIRKIVSDDDPKTSNSQQKTQLSESMHTSVSTFTSLNTPTPPSTAVSTSNEATTTSTFSLPKPFLSSTANLIQKQSEDIPFKIQENLKPELVPQTKTSSEFDQPTSLKLGGFKFDLKAPESQPQTNLFTPVVSSSSDSSILQFKSPPNVAISKQNSPTISSMPSAPTFQFSGGTFGSPANTTPSKLSVLGNPEPIKSSTSPKLGILDQPESLKSSTPPKLEAGLKFNFQTGTLSTSNLPPVTFTAPLTTKPVHFGPTTTTSSMVSPFGGTPFKENTAKSSPFDKTNSLLKSNIASTPPSSHFIVPTTSITQAQSSVFGATSSVTNSPFGTLPTTTKVTNTTLPFGSFTTTSFTTAATASVTPSFGFVSSTSAPTSLTSAKPGRFSFGGGNSAPTFGTDKSSSFSFVSGGNNGTSTAISTNASTSVAPPAFGKVATTSNIFGNAPPPSSVPFGSIAGTGGFGTVTTSSFGTPAATTSSFSTPKTTISSFGIPAATTSAAFGTSAFSNTGTSLSSTSKFSQSGFGSSNPTTTFNSNTQSLPTFGTNTQPRSTFGSNSTSAFAPNTTQSSTSTFGGANTSFGTISQPASKFGSNSQAFGSATQPATSVFGSSFGSGNSVTPPTAPSFGSTAPQTSAPTFGNSSATPTFGSSSFSTNTFGPNTTQTGFGSSTTTTGFGSTNTQPGFSSTPQTGFGTAVTQSGFGSTTQSAFGSTPQSTFGAVTTQATGFGTNSQQPFGSASQTSFGSGQQPVGFGSSNNQTGFGANAPPAFGSGSQPAFGTTPSQPQGFSFGGGSIGAAPSPSSGVFSFGSANDPNKPFPNFSAGSNFGAPQQPFNVPNFNAPAPGMFSIGSGGSSTAKSRSGRSRRRV